MVFLWRGSLSCERGTPVALSASSPPSGLRGVGIWELRAPTGARVCVAQSRCIHLSPLCTSIHLVVDWKPSDIPTSFPMLDFEREAREREREKKKQVTSSSPYTPPYSRRVQRVGVRWGGRAMSFSTLYESTGRNELGKSISGEMIRPTPELCSENWVGKPS